MRPILSAAITLAIYAQAFAAEPVKPAAKIVVIAHRGVHVKAPENSLPAIQAAIDIGCDYVEVDVRRTQDGALVLMHDSSVDRTTEGRGKVSELTLAEIKSLDVGIKRGEVFRGERVPTFAEALALCRGRIKVYVDLKSAPPAEILAAIAEQDMLKDVVIYGSVDVLREIKRLDSDVWIMPDHPGGPAAINALVADLHPETLDGNIVRWTREEVDAAHQAGVQVWVDNPAPRDNEQGIRKAIELGVDAIQTDRPETVIKLLTKLGKR